jgi:amino acid transporter
MGWAMFLESLIATIGTALAAGGYVAFLLNPDSPSKQATTGFAIMIALVFFVVQYLGVKEQAVIMLWLTHAAILALVWFWLAQFPVWPGNAFSLGRRSQAVGPASWAPSRTPSGGW